MSITITNLDESYVIYKNIKHFCNFRGIKMIDYKELTEAEVRSMNKIEINCMLKDKSMKIIYIPEKSKFTKPADLNTLLQEGAINIVIKHTKIKKIKTSSLKTKVTLLDGKYFLVNFTKYLQKHGYIINIVPEDEISHILNLYKIPSRKCLSAISEHSHEVVWLGGKLDDIVYVEYPTTASCEVSSNYKIVSKEIPLIDDGDDDESFTLS